MFTTTTDVSQLGSGVLLLGDFDLSRVVSGLRDQIVIMRQEYERKIDAFMASVQAKLTEMKKQHDDDISRLEAQLGALETVGQGVQ